MTLFAPLLWHDTFRHTFVTLHFLPHFCDMTISPHFCDMTLFATLLWPDTFRPTFVTWHFSPHFCDITLFASLLWHDTFHPIFVTWHFSPHFCDLTLFAPLLWHDTFRYTFVPHTGNPLCVDWLYVSTMRVEIITTYVDPATRLFFYTAMPFLPCRPVVRVPSLFSTPLDKWSSLQWVANMKKNSVTEVFLRGQLYFI
jgi:hypothetical protein